jgi:hypothetical protein
MKKITFPSNHSRSGAPLSAFLLISLLLACFALSPEAGATCQDVCLTNNNTLKGDDAFLSVTTSADDTRMGFDPL